MEAEDMVHVADAHSVVQEDMEIICKVVRYSGHKENLDSDRREVEDLVRRVAGDSGQAARMDRIIQTIQQVRTTNKTEVFYL